MLQTSHFPHRHFPSLVCGNHCEEEVGSLEEEAPVGELGPPELLGTMSEIEVTVDGQSEHPSEEEEPPYDERSRSAAHVEAVDGLPGRAVRQTHTPEIARFFVILLCVWISAAVDL